jgi:DNA-binding transcriptional ArsR family regulator
MVAIRFRLATDDESALAFACSPILETVLSLHVLTEPKHHALQHQWVRAMRRLPPELKHEIGALSFLYRWTLPNSVLPNAVDGDDDFAAELARLRRLSTDVAAFELLRPLYDHGGVGTRAVRKRILADPDVRTVALRTARRHGRDARAAAEQLFTDPAALVERFAALLEAYWNEAFSSEWDRVEPLLAEGVAEAGRRIAADGVYAFLAGLAPALRVEPAEQQFGLDIPHDHVVTLSARNPLLLMPSVYVWPHVRVNCDKPWPLTLAYRAPHLAERRVSPEPERRARLYRALGDSTRLRILGLIAEQPRSTQELAPLISLTEAGASRHLRLLADVGILTSHREGYYVVYSIAPDAPSEIAGIVSRPAA